MAKPAPSRSHRKESTVPMRSVPASRARWTASSFSSSHASFAAEKYGSNGSPLSDWISSSCSPIRSSTSCERLSCQTTIGDSGAPVSASHASTDSPWWSSPQATTSSSAHSSSSPTASTTACEHLLAVLLDPPRLRMAVDLVAARLAHGLEPLVEQRRLDAGRSLVDAEQEHLRLLPHAGPLRLVSSDGSRGPEEGRRRRQHRHRPPVHRGHGGTASGEAPDRAAFPRTRSSSTTPRAATTCSPSTST